MKQPLTFADVQRLLSRSADLGGIVLVGGQALNYWVEAFGLLESEALSFDIDFLGDTAAVLAFAEGTGGTPRLAGMADAHSPITGIVTVELDGQLHQVDFLSSLKGFRERDIRELKKWAIPATVDHDAPEIQVMHPVHCLQSQIENVYGSALDRRSGPAGLRNVSRVRAAIIATLRITRQYIGKDLPRDAFRIVEKAHKLSLLGTALRALEEDGVDVAEAIPVEHLTAEFRAERWPQLQKVRQAALDKYRRRQQRRN